MADEGNDEYILLAVVELPLADLLNSKNPKIASVVERIKEHKGENYAAFGNTP